MKYNKLELGQIEAIVNKLGGRFKLTALIQRRLGELAGVVLAGVGLAAGQPVVLSSARARSDKD